MLYVGRLVESKRPQDAIRAVSQLSDESVVKFFGHVPFGELPAVYRAGEVLLLPSRAEGLPRTVLEAFASGVPVVSSHLEHTAPVVREGGETVVEEFRWQETVERTTAVLESLG